MPLSFTNIQGTELRFIAGLASSIQADPDLSDWLHQAGLFSSNSRDDSLSYSQGGSIHPPGISPPRFVLASTSFLVASSWGWSIT
jgi:hypothetical protein